MKDYEIVLTADRSFMSEYHLLPFLKGLRFASVSLLNPSIFFRLVGPQVPKTAEGKAAWAPYHTRRTEAALIDYGFSESQIAVVTPDDVGDFLGPRTKILSITVKDPLSRIHHYSLLNPMRRESYSSLSFKRLVRRLPRRKLDFRVVVEGPGAWQLSDREDRRRFGIDHVVVGEDTAEVVPQVFEAIMKRELVQEVIYAISTDTSKVPLVKGGVIEGLIEVARGCNRSCRFCVVSRLQCRRLQDIIAETKANVRYGQYNIALRSDDILNYGSKDVRVNQEAVRNLYESVSKVDGVTRVSQCYLNLASAVSEPSLINEISQIIGVGCEEYPYTTALVGIETGSSRLVDKYMPGKARPFKPKDWADVVEKGFSICDENRWVPLGMFVLGFPGETEEDVAETMALVERLRAYKSILIPFLFEAKGMLGEEASSNIKNMMPCHLELVSEILEHNAFWGKRLIKEQAQNLSIPRWLLPFISPFIDWGIRRTCQRLMDEAIASVSSKSP